MGMFSKSPAEQKLEDLTGGFILSDEYKALLRANNIEFSVGEHIKNQLKEEIKLNIVSEEGLETRLRYLIKQNAKKTSDTEKTPEVTQKPAATTGPLHHFEEEIKSLKVEYEAKEKVVVNLIEKSFAPPQITYDKFMDHVKTSTKVFTSEYDGAMNIVRLATRETPRIDTELENKISNMKAIISYIDDLTNELIISLSSNKESDTDVENLLEDMKNLIDSVKKYD
ncbi:MAG: hypothetical protein IJQ68_06770 [Methanobrevibacter sp.]|uniref:hypothetical protein n=1 Tax=Methanobrevibacter sp. TaxID=66852 RepID=UPI0025F438FD|nr:hypothetical protein [Methanobrevibacter sp.]MBR0271674.1 hypothetical protein [Methanobrevibacter sp.]